MPRIQGSRKDSQLKDQGGEIKRRNYQTHQGGRRAAVSLRREDSAMKISRDWIVRIMNCIIQKVMAEIKKGQK